MKNLFTFLCNDLFRIKTVSTFVCFVETTQAEKRNKQFLSDIPLLNIAIGNSQKNRYEGGYRQTRSNRKSVRKTRKH